MKNGQAAKGMVDLLIDTDSGWIIIDHKFTDKSKENLPSEALRYSGQLKVYKDSAEAATAKPVIGCWIHFPTFGEMLQIEFF
jgi:ATP-dependent exoDNAse (exonuclease V) beta subunit